MSGSVAPVTIRDLRWLFGESLLKAGARAVKQGRGVTVYAFGDGPVVPFVWDSISRGGSFRFDAYVGILLDNSLRKEFDAPRLICHTANFSSEFGLRPTPQPEHALACFPGWIDALQSLVANLPRDEVGLRQCFARDDFAGFPARYFMPFRPVG